MRRTCGREAIGWSRFLSVILIVWLGGACRGGEEAEETSPVTGEEAAEETSPAAAPGCNGTGLDDVTLSPAPPCVPAFTGPAPPGGSVAELQPYFDAYSWKTFVALNWPVKEGSTEPDPSVTIGQSDRPTVWESWKGAWETFLPDGGAPTPFGQTGELPEACRQVAGSGGAHLVPFAGKTPNVLTAFDEPFKTGPLIDTEGYYARFDILMNSWMFDYIVDHTLYNEQGQIAFGRDADFPADSSNDQPEVVGAIMVKAAWKSIPPSDRGRFHSRQLLVYTPASDNPPIRESCEARLMGLVGLHFARKTKNDPQWLWSTFEHVDNAPQENELPASGRFNFYEPGCPDCPVNEPPARPWNPNDEPDPDRAVQVVRTIPIPPEAAARTEAFHRALRAVNPASVWLNYELISTQWPTNAADPTDPTGAPAPVFLGNTTLETYIQGTVPNVSSSCILCHNNATDTQGRFSDFTFLLQLAESAANP